MTGTTDRPVLVPGAGPWRDAVGYDQWFETRWGAYASTREWRAVSRAARTRRGARVVDVGCGTARFTDRLAGTGAIACGVDREPAMLGIARENTAVTLMAGDVLALPLRDRAVDVVVSIALLEFVSDPIAAMAEIARVVRPGGRLVIGALNPRSPWGIVRRHEFTEAPWNTARFLTRSALRALGRPYGRVEVRAALYAPGPFNLVRFVGPVFEQLGHLCPAWGAFQVLVVQTDRGGGEGGLDRR